MCSAEPPAGSRGARCPCSCAFLGGVCRVHSCVRPWPSAPWSYRRRGRGLVFRGGHVAASHLRGAAVCMQPSWAQTWSGIAGSVGGCSAFQGAADQQPPAVGLSRSECLEGHEQSRQHWARHRAQAGSVIGARWVGHGGVLSGGAGGAALSPCLFPEQPRAAGRRGKDALGDRGRPRAAARVAAPPTGQAVRLRWIRVSLCRPARGTAAAGPAGPQGAEGGRTCPGPG